MSKLNFKGTYFGYTAEELEKMKTELIDKTVAHDCDLLITYDQSTNLFRSYFDGKLECALQGTLNEENAEVFVILAISYDASDMTMTYLTFDEVNEECIQNEQDFERFCEMIEDEEVMEM